MTAWIRRSWERFWRQPSKPYRNFQLVFTFLSANFVFPAMGYIFTPAESMAGFAGLNSLLGGSPWPAADAASVFFRILGAANVMTLGLMCLLLQWNIRHYRPVLLPLTFMKGLAAALWFAAWYQRPDLPLCLAAGVYDGLTCCAFVTFTIWAGWDIANRPDTELVPAPRS